jgi:hypothetical protein
MVIHSTEYLRQKNTQRGGHTFDPERAPQKSEAVGDEMSNWVVVSLLLTPAEKGGVAIQTGGVLLCFGRAPTI